MNIVISIQCHNTLSVDSVWPDGDAPDEITEDAVLGVIKDSLGAEVIGPNAILRLLNEWNLQESATLKVSIEGRRDYYRPIME